jgi:hypothetical protein
MTNNPTPKESRTGKRSAMRAQRKKTQSRDRLIIIGIITVFALGIAALLIVPNLPAAPVNPDQLSRPEALPRPMVDGTATGDPNAPIQVEDFSDFKCTHCAAFYEETEATLINDYVAAGLVYFKYVPMSFIAPDSYTSAEAAYCAMDQGKFWEYHDYIFENYGVEFTDGFLNAIAVDLGLDMDVFNECFDNGKYEEQVLQDYDYAVSLGVTGTPTFNVNGQLIDRYTLLQTIDQMLNE